MLLLQGTVTPRRYGMLVVVMWECDIHKASTPGPHKGPLWCLHKSHEAVSQEWLWWGGKVHYFNFTGLYPTAHSLSKWPPTDWSQRFRQYWQLLLFYQVLGTPTKWSVPSRPALGCHDKLMFQLYRRGSEGLNQSCAQWQWESAVRHMVVVWASESCKRGTSPLVVDCYTHVINFNVTLE